MSDYPTAQDIARYRRHDNTPELSPAEAVIVARFESAVTPPEVQEARVVEEVARAMGAALRDDLGERGLNWEPGIDVARRLLADPRVVATCRFAQDGGAEEAVRRVEALAAELESWPAARILSPHDAASRLRAALAPQADR